MGTTGGGALTLTAGSPTVSGAGGALSISGGASSFAAGGSATIKSGNGGVNGSGGNFTVTAGTGAGTGKGGNFTFQAGNSGAGVSSSPTGGTMSFLAGSTTTGNLAGAKAGSINFVAGTGISGTSPADNGTIAFIDGNGQTNATVSNNTFATNAAWAIQGKQRVTTLPATIADLTPLLIINGPTTGTVTMSAAPADGQVEQICTTANMTALTISANTGQSLTGWSSPSALNNTQGVAFIYQADITTWVRLY